MCIFSLLLPRRYNKPIKNIYQVLNVQPLVLQLLQFVQEGSMPSDRKTHFVQYVMLDTTAKKTAQASRFKESYALQEIVVLKDHLLLSLVILILIKIYLVNKHVNLVQQVKNAFIEELIFLKIVQLALYVFTQQMELITDCLAQQDFFAHLELLFQR